MIKMNNIKKYIMISLMTPFLFMACTQDFLGHEPYGVMTDVVFYSTVEGITQGVTGTYAAINTCPAGLHNLEMMYLAYGSIASDEAEAGGEQGGGDIIDFQNWDKGTPQVSEPKAIAQNFWGYNYKTILRANSTLEGIKTFRTNNPEADVATLKLLSQYEGELEFILAFTHFKLMQVYGGIPIVDHQLGSSEYGITRNTISETLHFVQEHLLKAVELLPLRSEFGIADMGRATKGAAEALLAKAYLYEAAYAENYSGDERFTGCENTYGKALQYAENVINSNQYELVGINGETFDTYWSQNGSTLYPDGTPGYRYIFTTAGENSKESIFETQMINDGFNYMLSRGTYLTVYNAVRNTSKGSFGWGFNCPTDDLLNAYGNDPRRLVTIGRTGDPIYIATGWDVMDCLQSPTNMIGRKYEASPEEYWANKGSDGNGPNNFPFIRYADVVLMAAEAALKTNDNSKALNYVNQVRKRARNGAATGTPADLSSVNIDDIAKERQLELALEGHRFFDLVRWGKTNIMDGQAIQKYLGGVEQTPAYSTTFVKGKNEFFPIPLVEIINANGSLIQNPGYN